MDPDAVSTDTASNVTSVGVINKCYYAIIYPCQFLEITFLVRWELLIEWYNINNSYKRYPDGVTSDGNTTTTEYDITSVRQDVTFLDTNGGTNTFCAPISGFFLFSLKQYISVLGNILHLVYKIRIILQEKYLLLGIILISLRATFIIWCNWVTSCKFFIIFMHEIQVIVHYKRNVTLVSLCDMREALALFWLEYKW